MGELGGFLKIDRVTDGPGRARRGRADYREFLVQRRDEELREQGARCMDCGVPFCHNGCPLGNLIPDWNDLVYRDRWQRRDRQLHATNNFPEFTGRLCPAPCEAACVLEISEGDAVTIKQIENAIIDRAWDEGWVVPAAAARARPAAASPSSAPARRAWPPRSSCAARATASSLFERDEAAGGLVRFGVPGLQDREDGRRAPRASSSSPRASSCAAASTSASTSPATSCAPSSTRSCWRPARACRATCRSRAASSTASTSRWTTSTCATAGSRRSSARADRRRARARRDHRRGQARRRHRRRRHRRRLRRQLDPRGRAVGRRSSSCSPSRRSTAPTTARRGRCGR